MKWVSVSRREVPSHLRQLWLPMLATLLGSVVSHVTKRDRPKTFTLLASATIRVHVHPTASDISTQDRHLKIPYTVRSPFLPPSYPTLSPQRPSYINISWQSKLGLLLPLCAFLPTSSAPSFSAFRLPNRFSRILLHSTNCSLGRATRVLLIPSGERPLSTIPKP